MTGSTLRLPAAALVLAAVMSGSVPAGEGSPLRGTGSKDESRLRQAVRQLEAEEFVVRKAARRELLDAGLPAVDLLQGTLHSAQGHLATEGVQLLEELTRSNDATIAAAATAALQALAGCENADVARLAATALEPAAVLPEASPLGLRLAVGGPLPQALVPGPPFGPDGKRAVDIEVAGRKVRIEEVRGGRITVRITETIDGQERTTETVAENAADLLRKDRAVFELYLKHLVRQQPPQVAGGNFGIPMRIQTRIRDGHRQMRVEERDRVIEIEDHNGRQIQIRITDVIQGQETTREIAAEDLAQLREQDPEAAKVYEQWTGGREVGGFPIGRFRLPAPTGP